MPQIIPLTSDPSSYFDIKIDGQVFQLETKYNSRGVYEPFWTLSFYQNNVPIVQGLPLILGTNILQKIDVDIGAMFMFDLREQNANAGFDNLGTDVILVHYTAAEAQDIING